MPVYEIQYVMDILGAVPKSITFLLKSDMKVPELVQCYTLLKEQGKQSLLSLTGKIITKEAAAIKVKKNFRY